MDQSQVLLSWLMVGALAGYLARFLVPTRMGLFGDVVIGIVGGVVGGVLFNALSESGMSGLSLGSMLVSFIAAVVMLGLARLVIRPDRGLVIPAHQEGIDRSPR